MDARTVSICFSSRTREGRSVSDSCTTSPWAATARPQPISYQAGHSPAEIPAALLARGRLRPTRSRMWGRRWS